MIQTTRRSEFSLQLDSAISSSGDARIIPVLGLLGALLLGISAPRVARANTGNSFLETIGFTTAVGTVLGASTLPFYDQPGKHLENLAYGASLGAVVGLGVYLYQRLSGDSHAGLFASSEGELCLPTQSGEGELCLPTQSKDNAREKHAFSSSIEKSGNAFLVSESRTELSRSGPFGSFAGVSARPTQVWMPLVSLTW